MNARSGYRLATTLEALVVTHLVTDWLEWGMQAARQQPDARTRVLKTITAIQNRPQQRLSTEESAALAGLSVSHFSALFRQLTGESPKRYATRVKMLRARQLLLETVQSVRTISTGLGFEDPLYFSRLFRAFHNRSPSEFRRCAVGNSSIVIVDHSSLTKLSFGDGMGIADHEKEKAA